MRYSRNAYVKKIQNKPAGYIIFFAGGPISWCSRKQPLIAQSTTEAEYVAAAECCKKLVYLKSLLEELLNDRNSFKHG